MGTRAGTLASETILRPGYNNLNVRVRGGVRFPFKSLTQSRTPVSGRNIEKWPVLILYVIPLHNVADEIKPVTLADCWQTIDASLLTTHNKIALGLFA